MNVLVADDDPVITHLLHSGLRSRGWNVTVAADAMQAVMFAVRNVPDAIVLDINMPGGNGTIALQRLKASSKTRNIPVLVLSGVKDQKVVDNALTLGAREFLPKPADLDVIDCSLRKALDLPTC